MWVVKRILLLLALVAVIVASLSACNSSKSVTYTDAELVKMSASDLYDTLRQNGLQVDDDLKEVLTDKQLAEYIKSDFHLLVDGVTSRSSFGYQKLAEDIKRIHANITQK